MGRSIRWVAIPGNTPYLWTHLEINFMMVSCPGCNNNYLVDERKVPPKGAMLTCRECGKRWRVGAPVAQATGQSSASPGSSKDVSSLLKLIPSQNDSSASLQNPVNCPKCGHFFVPYEQPGATLKPAAPRKESRPRRKILLVEDQNYFAELTREALGDEFETTVTSNLGAARNLVATGGFDLVILDLSLEEGQDGSLMLQTTHAAGVPVLVFTARDESDLYAGVWEQLKAAGATDILIKGMNVGDELRQKVRALLEVKQTQQGALNRS